MQNEAIGMIDSGLGGLTIRNSIAALLPFEPIIYFADHAYFPYGEKKTIQIRARIVKLIKYLTKKRVKIFVIACNTATVAGIDYYRKIFPKIPIIGVVPVIKSAATLSLTKHFAVMTTNYTAKSNYQRNLINKFAAGCRVENISCPGLVDLIEADYESEDLIKYKLVQIFKPILKENIDFVVLGCTHFPFLKKQISDIVGKKIKIIDSSAAVARQVERIIIHNRIKNKQINQKIMHNFYTTGKAEIVGKIASKLLKYNVKFEHVTI